MNSFFKRNEKYTTIAVYTIITAMVIVLLTLIINNTSSISEFFSEYSAVFSPLVYAFIISFLCNPMMKLFETYVFRFGPAHPVLNKCRRGFSLAMTILVLLLIIALLLLAIIPAIVGSYNEFSGKVSVYIISAQNWVDNFIKTSALFNGQYEGLNDFLNANEISSDLQQWIGNLSSIVSKIGQVIIDSAGNIVEELKNLIIGFFISIYFLASKEKIMAQTKKFLYSIFNRRHYLNFVNFGRYVNKAFSAFIVGKVVDSFIITILNFIIFAIAGIAYTPLVAIICGITNIIPVFGPFIGGFIGGALLLIVQPEKVILFIILQLLIQQLDGNVIGPKILGGTVGISSMWVLVSIVIFGGFFGITGMIIGVPIMAVIFAVASELVNHRLKDKNRPQAIDFYYADPPLVSINKDYPYLGKEVEIPEIPADAQPSARIEQEERLKDIARKKFILFLKKVGKAIWNGILYLLKGLFFLLVSLKNLIVNLFCSARNKSRDKKDKQKRIKNQNKKHY